MRIARCRLSKNSELEEEEEEELRVKEREMCPEREYVDLHNTHTDKK